MYVSFYIIDFVSYAYEINPLYVIPRQTVSKYCDFIGSCGWRVCSLSESDKNICSFCPRARTGIICTRYVLQKIQAWHGRRQFNLIGNLPELFQSQVGDADFKYQKEYGDIVRIKGAFGVSLDYARWTDLC